MGNLYVRSTDGSDADNGTTWALAKATVAGAAAVDAAGDAVWVSQAHAESVATMAAAWAGTNASPVVVVGAADSAEPPTATSSASSITITGTSATWTGATYAYGLSFLLTSASSMTATFNGVSGFAQVFEACQFAFLGAGSGSALAFGASAGSSHGLTTLIDCGFRFAAAGQSIAVYRDTLIKGGSWTAGGTSPTGVFALAGGGRPATLRVDGFDFSALSPTVNLVKSISEGGAKAIFRNCRLPDSWTGALITSGQAKLGSRVEMHNCDSGDSNYRMWVEDYAGSVTTDTTVVRTGGASDGVTPLSWRMSTGANVAYPASALVSPEIVRRQDGTGSPITVTVEVITDGVTLTDAECWLEVQYLGTSGYPLALHATDAKAGVLAATAAQSSSTAAWTTTGLASPTKQALSVTLTPAEAGVLIAVVKLAKPGATVYVDPMLSVA